MFAHWIAINAGQPEPPRGTALAGVRNVLDGDSPNMAL
jgi:hypothetical protein